MDSTVARRFCFTEEDDGLASVAEASFSGNQQHHPFFLSRPLFSQAKSSLRNISFSSCSSPRSRRFHDSGKYYYYEEVVAHQPHFLEACSLCKKPLADNKDIFMYRGDTPFCSEECREEQIGIDEAREKCNLSASMKALRNDQNKKSKSASPNKAQGYPYRSGTVAAA